jgi:general secretion pathway protein B
MSFILDALKKAESERNRQQGPVLMDARIAPPRRGLPTWGWILGGVLLVNLVLLAWVLFDAPASAPEQPAGAAAALDAGPAVPPSAAVASPVAVQSVPVPEATPVRASAPSLSTDIESLPTAQDLQAVGVTLPELQLNLHIYDPLPANRSVLLNGQRLREGEFTPHGVRVERITEQFVVLETAGRRFRIAAGG